MSDTPNIKNPGAIEAAKIISATDKHNIVFAMSQNSDEALKKAGYQATDPNAPLMYALNNATGSANKKAPRLAFTENPSPSDNYLGLYKSKRRLLPDEVIKQIRIQDHLIAAILRTRGSHLSLFGHLRKDRFDLGLEVALKKEFYSILTPEQFEKVMERVKKFERTIMNCGHTSGLEYQDRLTLAQFIDTQIQNGLGFGRFGTEVIYDREGESDADGNFPFHRFRPIDIGTIYRCVRKGDTIGSSLRETAMKLLESLSGEKPNIDMRKLREDQYAWLQVIEGTPRQAFTHREMLVYNLFPCTDIEMNGYPVSPLDTVVSSVTTHISIDAYKKLYFQNGRATKGMLVIKSDEVNEEVLNGIKLQFNASVNSVSNSFRTPIFGMGKEDDVEWLPFSGEGLHDSDFQFMYDQIARNIMSAFSMSPDELPGYSHLTRGTNSQTLSECFDPNVMILTKNGHLNAYELLGDSEERKIEIWTGAEWANARIFWTGEKEVRETVTQGNLSLKTSPDHRFLTLDELGNPFWKHQGELRIGDPILVNSKPIDGNKDLIPTYNGKKITPEIMEFLGWITGDGTMVAPKKRAGGFIKAFYHHDKEVSVQDSHYEYLSTFGINIKKVVKTFTKEETDIIAERYGFESVSEIRRYNTIYDTKFVNWMIELGFSPSFEGKTIPSFIFSLPTEYRSAFLRGLFSADGHATTLGSIILTAQNDEIRDGARQLLIGLGIRANASMGINRRSGFNEQEKTFSHKLSVKDTDKYWELIGFLQSHKNDRRMTKKWTLNSLPKQVMMNLANVLVTQDNRTEELTKTERDVLVGAASGKRKVSKEYIENVYQKMHLKLPEWLCKYGIDYVKSVSNHEKYIDMVDVEVLNEEHAFCLSGIIVHNSNNEFKLTAARDTGLRPLVLKLQTFFNEILFPIIDPLLAKICEIKLCGIDAQSKEQESTRIQQDMPTFMTYDEVLHEVDKDPVGRFVGGTLPFNERFQLLIDKYKNVGEIVGTFLGDSGAFVDPMLRYKRDPFALQHMQLLAQISPMAVQAYFAPRPFAIDILKMCIKDSLEEDENI